MDLAKQSERQAASTLEASGRLMLAIDSSFTDRPKASDSAPEVFRAGSPISLRISTGCKFEPSLAARAFKHPECRNLDLSSYIGISAQHSKDSRDPNSDLKY